MADSTTLGPPPFYSVSNISASEAMGVLRAIFPTAQADDLNFVLFSTSGVHGHYGTIEDAEAHLRQPGEDSHHDVTFLVVNPRTVTLRYGNCQPKTQDDIAFLKALRQSSHLVLCGLNASPSAAAYELVPRSLAGRLSRGHWREAWIGTKKRQLTITLDDSFWDVVMTRLENARRAAPTAAFRTPSSESTPTQPAATCNDYPNCPNLVCGACEKAASAAGIDAAAPEIHSVRLALHAVRQATSSYLSAWLRRELPSGTVIGNEYYWAGRIVNKFMREFDAAVSDALNGSGTGILKVSPTGSIRHIPDSEWRSEPVDAGGCTPPVTAASQPDVDGRVAIAWRCETKYGPGYSFANEFWEAFPTFPNPPRPQHEAVPTYRERLSEIEDAVAAGTMNACQCFTQMRQLVVAAKQDHPAPDPEAVKAVDAYLRIDPAGVEPTIAVMPDSREKWATIGYVLRPLGVIDQHAPAPADHLPDAGKMVGLGDSISLHGRAGQSVSRKHDPSCSVLSWAHSSSTECDCSLSSASEKPDAGQHEGVEAMLRRAADMLDGFEKALVRYAPIADIEEWPYHPDITQTAEAIRRLASDLHADEAIACDVKVAPATTYRAGVRLSTVIAGIRLRAVWEGRPFRFSRIAFAINQEQARAFTDAQVRPGGTVVADQHGAQWDPPAIPDGTREAAMVVIERDQHGKPTVWCDPEIVDLVGALNTRSLRTVASCSGHGGPFGNIVLADGRELLILPDFDSTRFAERALRKAFAAGEAGVPRYPDEMQPDGHRRGEDPGEFGYARGWNAGRAATIAAIMRPDLGNAYCGKEWGSTCENPHCPVCTQYADGVAEGGAR
jgi:hypothetical protein